MANWFGSVRPATPFPPPPPPKKKFFFLSFEFFVNKITHSIPPPRKKNHLLYHPPPPPPPKKKKKKIIKILCKKKFTYSSQSSFTFTPSKRKHFFFQTWILLKKKSLTLATPHPLPSHPSEFFFVRFGFFIKKSLSRFFVEENFTYPSRHPPPPPHTHTHTRTEKRIHLCIILWILVQSDTINGLILSGGHCDLYIMVQRFCLVSLTISNRKTSYRSLTQTAGSTSNHSEEKKNSL